jgi:ATP-dependent Lon protease
MKSLNKNINRPVSAGYNIKQMKNYIKEQIKQVEKEMNRAVDLGNYSYAQALFFDDLLPLQKTLERLK